MTYDFYNPFFSAVIITNDGIRFPLWTLEDTPVSDNVSGSGNSARFRAQGVPASDDDYTPHSLAYAQSCTVDMDLGQAPSITVELKMPLEDGRRIMNSRVVEWASSLLQVQLGYVHGGGAVLLPPMEGVLLQPEVSYGVDATITLTAQGTGGYGLYRAQSGRVYRGSRIDIIRQVVGGANSKLKRRLTVNVDAVRDAFTDDLAQAAGDTFTSFLRSGQIEQTGLVRRADFFRRMFTEQVEECQGYITDWAIIWKLVRECRCVFDIDGDELRIFPISSWYNQAPKRRYRFYDFPEFQWAPDFNDQTWPILSVQSTLGALYLPNAVVTTVIQDVNPETGEVDRRVIRDGDAKFDRTKPGDAGRAPDEIEPGPDDETGEGGGYFSGDPGDDQIIAQAESAMESIQNTMGVQLELSTLLDPDVRPGTVVQVAGMSARHDGNYAVLNASYTVSANGGEMTLGLISNTGIQGPFGEALGVATFDDFEQTLGDAFGNEASAVPSNALTEVPEGAGDVVPGTQPQAVAGPVNTLDPPRGDFLDGRPRDSVTPVFDVEENTPPGAFAGAFA